MNATSGCQYDFSPKNVAKFKQLSEQTVGGTASFRFPESVFVFFFVSSVPLCFPRFTIFRMANQVDHNSKTKRR
jgi:hypothetical protein